MFTQKWILSLVLNGIRSPNELPFCVSAASLERTLGHFWVTLKQMGGLWSKLMSLWNTLARLWAPWCILGASLVPPWCLPAASSRLLFGCLARSGAREWQCFPLLNPLCPSEAHFKPTKNSKDSPFSPPLHDLCIQDPSLMPLPASSMAPVT